MLVVTVFGNETGNPDDNASTVKELYQESYDDSRYGLQFEVLTISRKGEAVPRWM